MLNIPAVAIQSLYLEEALQVFELVLGDAELILDSMSIFHISRHSRVTALFSVHLVVTFLNLKKSRANFLVTSLVILWSSTYAWKKLRGFFTQDPP